MDLSKWKFAVFGGDARQSYLCRALREKGASVASFGVPGEKDGADWQSLATDADCILLPLPLTRDGVHLSWEEQSKVDPIRLDLFARACKTIVFGGKIPKRFRKDAEENGARVFDYFDSEYLQILNALPTAEGALFVAMRELTVTLDGANVAVIGYGRIGRILTEKLVALGAHVTVYERKEEKHAEIELAHAAPRFFFDECGKNLLLSIASDCRVIFNTVPEQIFTQEVLESLPKECLFVDLASPPGGIDQVAAMEFGVKHVWATALPGKYAPESAASYLAKTLFATLAKLSFS